MNLEVFKTIIEDIKYSKLGGLDAQFKLAPKLRLKYNQEKIEANNPKIAAVLALLYPNTNNKMCILLTQRASYKGTHSAQISFPGGKQEKIDKNLEYTSLRETFEEVGIASSSINIIRELTDVYIPPSNFLATPFLGFTNHTPKFILNHEVSKIIEVPIQELLIDSNVSYVSMTTSYMKKIDVPCFKFNNHIVWGATAMMLSEIKELLK